MPSKTFLKIPIVLALVTLGSWGCVSLALAKQKSADAFDFPRSLSLGMRGNDVRSLQEFLARDPQIYPERSVTGFFGPRTREAVKKWQQKNGLEAVGVVGPKTIAKIREISRAATTKSDQSPAPISLEATTTTPIAAISGDTTPPEAALTVNIPAPTNVYIEFNPSEEVIALYEYGLTTKYGSIQEVWNQYFSSPTGTYIENLIPATIYQVRAKVTDRAGNIGYSLNYTFTTPSLEQAAIISSGPSVASSATLPAAAVNINWSTNIACTGTLYYGADASYGNAQTSGYATKHTVTITGLAPGATYLYKITCATAKKTVESSNFSFTATSSTASADFDSPLASVLQILIDIIKKIKF